MLFPNVDGFVDQTN